MTFAERLRHHRERHALSLDTLAAQAGISKTYLWELEKGQALTPSAEVVERLADILQLSMDELWKGISRFSPYGFCPHCGEPGVLRERRPNGNDTCKSGHVYPSKAAQLEARPTPPAGGGDG